MNNMREKPGDIGCSALNNACTATVSGTPTRTHAHTHMQVCGYEKIELFAVVDIHQSSGELGNDWMGDEGEHWRNGSYFQTFFESVLACMSTGVTYMFCSCAFVWMCLCVCVCSYKTVNTVPKEGMERWGSRWEEEGKEQRQSGIIVTDRAAPWWAMRCIVCHLTNLNQSIISLSPHHQSISLALRPPRAFLYPAAWFRLHQPIKCHSTM